MTIKLEVGKLYRTRDGRKAFCSVYSEDRRGYHYVCLIEGYEEVFSYPEHGRLIHDMEQSLDIVSEWSEWVLDKDGREINYGTSVLAILRGCETGRLKHAVIEKDAIDGWIIDGGKISNAWSVVWYMPIPAGPWGVRCQQIREY